MIKYEVVLTESFSPKTGDRSYHSETVVRTYETMEEARRHTLMCNTKAFSNQYYHFRKVDVI